MKFLFKMFFLPFICVLSVSIHAMDVKVLLATFKPGDTLTLSAKDGFVLKDPVSDHALQLENERKKFDLSCAHDGIYLDGKRLFKEKIIFEPYGSVCSYNNQKYWGRFLIYYNIHILL